MRRKDKDSIGSWQKAVGSNQLAMGSWLLQMNKRRKQGNFLFRFAGISMLSKSLYNLFLFLYSCGIRVVAIANPKARKWISGRKDILATINYQLSTLNSHSIWIHCASLGEFEQGRPLLEELKVKNPGTKIILTFFSPSGYEVMKDYKGADFVFYLPMDSPVNAKKFLDTVNPALVLWVKYEYW